MTTNPQPKRGEIWNVKFEPSVGAEIRKLRPAVVLNPHSIGRLPLRIVVPITTWNPIYINVTWLVHLPGSSKNGLSKDSAADAFQVKSLSVTRFLNKLGEIEDAQLTEIAEAVAICVGAF